MGWYKLGEMDTVIESRTRGIITYFSLLAAYSFNNTHSRSVLVDMLLFHKSRIHSNRHVLALVIRHNLCNHKNIGKNRWAFLQFVYDRIPGM